MINTAFGRLFNINNVCSRIMSESLNIHKDGTVNLFQDTTLRYFENFYSEEETKTIFEELYLQTSWQQDNITVFGKTYAQPRLTALFSNNSQTYSYSGIKMHPNMITPQLISIQQKISKVCNYDFNSVLLNLYRDGKDSNGWHSDNEKELGENPVIASVSFGASRFFHMKHKSIKELFLKIPLTRGSLMIMEGTTQKYWLHKIAKTARPVESRINLTFRKII